LKQQTASQTSSSPRPDEWLNEQGYISCESAITAANEALHSGQPEIALAYCQVAYRLLDRTESQARTRVLAARA
jgi:hypothetical protein